AVPAGSRPRAARESEVRFVVNRAPAKNERAAQRIVRKESPVGKLVLVRLSHVEAVIEIVRRRHFHVVAIDTVALIVQAGGRRGQGEGGRAPCGVRRGRGG